MENDICSKCKLLNNPELYLLTSKDLKKRGWEVSTIHVSGKFFEVEETGSYAIEFRCDGNHTCCVQYEDNGKGLFRPTQILRIIT